MTWKAYRVVFKLKSPMHIGCGKVGNVQRTRPYVTGRVFWGALTMRLTRNQCDRENRSATNSEDYRNFGDRVHNELAFTYLYPAIKQSNDNYEVQWPWDENLFRRRFLSSYASTALVYPQQAAEAGLLHEVEFISPRTLDNGKQVYLVGYVFEKDGCDLNWQDACDRLQMGGERGYGWGDVGLDNKEFKPLENNDLFNGKAIFSDNTYRPTIEETEQLLAHTRTENVSAKGEIEPLVGRESKTASKIGESVAFSEICWTPGSKVERSHRFSIGNFGIWSTL